MSALTRHMLIIAAVACCLAPGNLCGGEPPAINPFGQTPSEREDAVPGRIELSDGSIHAGLIYLTRDKRLQIYDEKVQRQREIPLQVVKSIDCKVKREWLEKEWKFKETTSDEKLYTGRSYPAREYIHTITLKDGRKIEGPLAAVVYVQPPKYGPVRPEEPVQPTKPLHFLLQKRGKGEMGQELKDLVYVKRVVLNVDEKKGGGERTK